MPTLIDRIVRRRGLASEHNAGIYRLICDAVSVSSSMASCE